MRDPKSTLNGLRSTALLLLSLTALLFLILTGASCSKRTPRSPIVFGHSAVPNPTNANLVCVPVTNLSDSVVVFIACPPQVKSNGIWGAPTIPYREPMVTLAARQSGLMMVPATSLNQNVRVPVLWGYDDHTPGASTWQQITEDLVARLQGHGGLGFLYTNYLTGLKP